MVGGGVDVGVGEGFVWRLDERDGTLHEALGDDVAVVCEGDCGCWDRPRGKGLADNSGSNAILIADGGRYAVLSPGREFRSAELCSASIFDRRLALELFLKGDVQNPDISKNTNNPISTYSNAHSNKDGRQRIVFWDSASSRQQCRGGPGVGK